jgi:hypothetical protein
MKRFLVLAAALAALVASAPALAGDVTVKLGFSSGGLSLAADKGGALKLVDARGTGAGWQLRLTTRQAVTVTQISVRCAAGSTCTLPRTVTSYPLVVSPGTPTTILSAAGRSGMGALQIVVRTDGGSSLSFSVA